MCVEIWKVVFWENGGQLHQWHLWNQASKWKLKNAVRKLENNEFICQTDKLSLETTCRSANLAGVGEQFVDNQLLDRKGVKLFQNILKVPTNLLIGIIFSLIYRVANQVNVNTYACLIHVMRICYPLFWIFDRKLLFLEKKTRCEKKNDLGRHTGRWNT